MRAWAIVLLGWVGLGIVSAAMADPADGAGPAGDTLRPPEAATAPRWDTRALVPPHAEPPRIDGRLDEPAWGWAAPLILTCTALPVPGHRAGERTELRLVRDESHLYAAFRCFDRRADRIRSRAARRDEAFDDDWVALWIDADAGLWGAAELYVNPHGSQMDALLTAQGDEVSVDYRFDAAATIDSAGWSAELAIPFASIAPARGRRLTLRVIAIRNLARTGEQIMLPALDPLRPGWQAQGFPVVLASRASPPKLNAVLAVVSSVRASRRQRGVAVRDVGAQWGANATCRLAPGVELDATWRPDFSQVEADVRQVEVNRRFPVSYPEKRPFFLLGRGAFALAAEGWGVGRAFHSRTIEQPRVGLQLRGRSPSGHRVAGLWALDEGAPSSGRGPARIGLVRCTRQVGPAAAVGGMAGTRRCGASSHVFAGLDADLLAAGRVRLQSHWLFSRTREAVSSDPTGPTTRRGSAAAVAVSTGGRHVQIETGWTALGQGFDLPLGYVPRTGVRAIQLSVAGTVYPHRPWLARLSPSVVREDEVRPGADEWERQWRLALAGHPPGRSSWRVERIQRSERFARRRFAQNGWRVAGALGLQADWTLQGSLLRRGGVYYDASCPHAGRLQAWQLLGSWRPCHALRAGLRFAGESLRTDHAESSYRARLLDGRIDVRLARRFHGRVVLEIDGDQDRILGDLVLSWEPRRGPMVHLGLGTLHRRCGDVSPVADEDRTWKEGCAGPYRLDTWQFFLKTAYRFPSRDTSKEPGR